MLDDVTPKSQLRKRSTRENLVACCYPATTEKVTRLSHRRECNSRDRRGSSAFTSGISCWDRAATSGSSACCWCRGPVDKRTEQPVSTGLSRVRMTPGIPPLCGFYSRNMLRA